MTTQIKFTTAEEAVKVIKSGDHVHLSSVASAPQCLINAMCARGEAGELKDVHIHHLHTEGPAPYADEKFEGVFQLDSFFVGGNVRKVTQSGYADYIPIFLSETQRLYRCGAVPCNVAMIQVSTPDKHGFVSLGTSVDATLAAVETADYVLAVVNKHVPRAFGQAMIHSSKIDYFVQDDTPADGGALLRAERDRDGHRQALRSPDRGRRDAADGHRRHSQCRAGAAGRPQEPRHPYRDVRRRRASAGGERRNQRRSQKYRQRARWSRRS